MFQRRPINIEEITACGLAKFLVDDSYTFVPLTQSKCGRHYDTELR
jgi:hypothetical protein